jgi:hypothetical protein
MTVEICTVWAPRPDSEQYRADYLEMMDYQKRSVERYGHFHTVVTDDFSLGWRYNTLPVTLPREVMPAMIAGVVERLIRPVTNHIVFVDVDVLVVRNLEAVFDGTFDLALTHRQNPVAPINNGVMYMDATGAQKSLSFFQHALSICELHWGGDQEAISRAAAPVPDEDCTEDRDGFRLRFLPMKRYAAVPKLRGHRHRDAFCVHFKGETKRWMAEYCRTHVTKD